MRLLLVLVISSVFLFSCSDKVQDENAQQAKTKTEQLDAAAFRSAVVDQSKDIIILDVRTPDEYAEGAIPNAINMDFLNTNFVNELKSLDKSKEVYVYCAAGGRSAKAARIMEDMGFERILELKGGLSAYQ